MKKTALLVFQTLVTIGFLAWVFGQEQVRQNTLAVLSSAIPGWILAGVVLAGAENFLGACRWRVFLVMLNVRLPFWQAVRLHFLGLFFNAFLIGSVGGDAVKVLILAAQGHRKSSALLSVVMDRVSGLGALILTCAVFIPPQLGWLRGSSTVSAVLAFVVVYLVATALMLTVSFVMTMTGVSRRVPGWAPFRAGLLQMCDSYFLFVARWRKTLVATGISVLMLLGYFLVYACAMRAFGVDLSVARVFALMPMVDIISAMPVSLGGVGVREKLFQVLLGDLAGVPPATAVWISITGYLTTLFWGLAGLLTLPFYRGILSRVKDDESLRNVG